MIKSIAVPCYALRCRMVEIKKAFCAHLCERRRHNVGIARVNYTKCMSSSRGRALTFLPSHVNSSSGVPIYPTAWSQMISHLGVQAQQQTQLAKCRESKVSGFSLHSLSRLFFSVSQGYILNGYTFKRIRRGTFCSN